MVVPRLLFRIHRWEVTDEALYVRYGLIWRTTELVPLSRIQTVDSVQGPLMRFFDLRTVTVSTASAHSTVVIPFLDTATAHKVVTHLVTITSAADGDAT